MNLQVPVSIGELIDKISILEIKSLNISNPDKLKNIRYELECLTNVLNDIGLTNKVKTLQQQLFETNQILWNLEEMIRQCEDSRVFDEKFIKIARSIYKMNDKRSYLKKEINLEFNSDIIEEKSYKT